MKKTSRLPLLSLLSLLSLASFADVPQVLTYRGVLRRTGGYERAMSLEMTFRLYDSKAPDTALWARTMRVPVDTNGVFYAELSDANGNDPGSATRSPTQWAPSRGRPKSASRRRTRRS